MEEIIKLIKVPFDILNATSTSEAATGYGFLMIFFGVAIGFIADMVMTTIVKMYKTTLDFFADIASSFASIFNKPKPAPVNMIDATVINDFKTEVIKEIVKLDKKVTSVTDKVDKLTKEDDLIS